MTRVAVDVHLEGLLVESRVVCVSGGQAVRLGEAPAAEVAFPGGDVHLALAGGAVRIDGERVPPGATVERRFGAVSVRLHVVASAKGRLRAPTSLGDPRIVVSTLAAVVLSLWVDVFSGFLVDHPEAVALFAAPHGVGSGPGASQPAIAGASAPQARPPAADPALFLPIKADARHERVDTRVQLPAPVQFAVGYEAPAAPSCGAECPPDAPSTPAPSTR